MGWSSWISGLPPHFFLLSMFAMALLWGRMPNRRAAFLLFLGYYLMGASDAPQSATVFFGAGAWLGVVYWLPHAALLSMPFGLLHGPTHKALRYVTALLVVSLPPLGLIGWLSPLLAAGAMFPGFGLAGLGAMLAVFALLAWVSDKSRAKRWMTVVALFAATVAFNAMDKGMRLQPADWFGQNTTLGKFPDPADFDASFNRQLALTSMVDESVRDGAKVILLPEETAGAWSHAIASIWQETARKAKEAGATILVGADTLNASGQIMNSVVALGADSFTVSARQPMPVSMWHPWKSGGYAGAVFAAGLVNIQGKTAAISFCFEDLLVWPMAWSFIADQPQLILSTANNWFGNYSENRIQRTSIELQARLYGVPLVRAVNFPASTKS